VGRHGSTVTPGCRSQDWILGYFDGTSNVLMCRKFFCHSLSDILEEPVDVDKDGQDEDDGYDEDRCISMELTVWPADG